MSDLLIGGRKPPEPAPMTEHAAKLAFAAIECAGRFLAAEGEFMAMVLVDSDTLAVMPLDLEGEPRPGVGLLPVVAQDVAPLREAVTEKQADLKAYAIVANGTLRSPDGKDEIDAIVVEVGVAGEASAHVVVQPYKLTETEGGFVGEPGILDVTANLLAPAKPKSSLILP